MAQLQDCVRAGCNKYARVSGPEKIYHKQEGRQSAHGRKRMEGVGGGVGNKMKKKGKEMR